jgi:hypothetical protein
VSKSVVDVIVPLHRPDRNYLEAVRSAQSSVQAVATRVLLVLHGIELDDSAISALRPLATVVRCDDGIPSPSGPRNEGLEHATAPFVFFLDSDDRLADRCLRQLVDVAEEIGADVVLPSILDGDGFVGTPLASSRRACPLDVVKHHLFARAHSFALIRRSLLERRGIEYPTGIRTGEDLVIMAQLYASGVTAMAFDAVYELVGHKGERITTSALPPGDQLAAVSHLVAAPWAARLASREREALAHRLLAVNLASGWRHRQSMGHAPSADDHAAARDSVLELAPRSAALLSLRDRYSLRFEETRSNSSLLLRPWAGLVPTSVRGLVSPRGPILYQARVWLVRRRRRRSRR